MEYRQMILTIFANFIGISLCSLFIENRAKKRLTKGLEALKFKSDGKFVPVYSLDDDSQDVELFVEPVLQKIGNEYFTFDKSTELIKNMPAQAAVFIVDHSVPYFDGLAVYKKIMEANPKNFFILNTAVQSDQILAEYMKLDGIRFVSKHSGDYKLNLEKAIREGIGIVANR